MRDTSVAQQIESQLSDIFQSKIRILASSPMSGGCINQSFHLRCTHQMDFFIKLNQHHLLPMFEAEAKGLQALAAATEIVIPKVITYGIHENYAYLILNFIDMNSSVDAQQLGKALALMHQHSHQSYGFDSDNFIGANPQSNQWQKDWYQFFTQQRLEKQRQMLIHKGQAKTIDALWQPFLNATQILFTDYHPRASLLHGDLWQGNVSGCDGKVCLYDPAVYYGDHETDLAMLELFGRPGKDFYASYQQIMPIDRGYSVRKNYYNLYHILNHANLFGGSYLNQALGIMQQLIVHADEGKKL